MVNIYVHLCFLMSPVIWNRFGEVKKTATIQVGHGETLLPLLSLMGFFKDEKPLTAENFALQHKRVFRSSQILPYAANLVFVLYECSDGLRVQLFLNEKPMIFPSMNHSAPLYERVREHYLKLLHGCDFNKECEVAQSNLRNTELWVKWLNRGLQGSISVLMETTASWLWYNSVYCFIYFISYQIDKRCTSEL